MKKLDSLKLLQQNNLPVLPYTVLTSYGYKDEIYSFLKVHNLKKYMVRTDSNDLFSPSINNASTDATTLAKIKHFLNEGYTVFIMHPGNTNQNYHSLNIMRELNEYIIEAVGPGFIATDLNRNNCLHESLVLSNNKHKIMDRKIFRSSFKADRKKRLNKCLPMDSYIFTYTNYPPLTDSELTYIKGTISKLNNIANKLKCSSNKWIASMSFLNLNGTNNEPIFWDVYCVN